MAQVIKIKRGGIASLVASTPTLQQGELLLATGSVNGLGATFFVASASNSPSLPYAKVESISDGPALASSLDGNFEGLLIHSSSDNKLYRYNGTSFVELPIAAGSFVGTLPVSNGGTNATSFADKAVIISQDSGTDTLSALALTTSGQLVIGGASGPAAATLTEGTGLTITNGDGSITIATNDGEIDHDSLLNFDAAEHFTQANITTVGTVTSGNVSAILPAGTVSGSEQVEDIVGDMLTGNTETLITVTYQDGDGTIDFVVDNDLSNYSNASTNFITTGASVGGDLTGTIASATVTKIQNTSITSTQAGYLATLDQSVSSSASPTFAGLTVTGDVSVQGSLTTVNSNEVNLGDRIITLNTADGAGDAGIQVHDTSTAETGSLLWDTDGNYWKVGVSGSTDYRLVEWDGETAGGGDFIHTDSNGRINAINTSQNGDLLISDGDGTFTVTNVIDGGTY